MALGITILKILNLRRHIVFLMVGSICCGDALSELQRQYGRLINAKLFSSIYRLLTEI